MFLFDIMDAGHTRLYLLPCHFQLHCAGLYSYYLPNSVYRLLVSSYHDGPLSMLVSPNPVTASKCERESVAIVLRISLEIGMDFKTQNT
jgi:hypothetical protein